jgi:hypothetical protein
MADRKKERKGGRKSAASKPKAAARVAATVGPMGRLPIGGGWGELTEPVPSEGKSGTGAMLPVPSDQPPPQRLQADEVILRPREPQAGTAPQTGIQSVSENVRSPQAVGLVDPIVPGSLAQAPIQEVAAPPVIAEVAATGRANLMGLASLGVAATGRVAGDVQQASAIIPGAGRVQADADRVPARTRKRTTGTRPARRVTKARLLRQADVAEAALKKLAPAHGGIGHNRQSMAHRGAPLTPTQYDRALAAIGRLRDALATGVPTRAAIAAMKAVARTLARTTTILGRWLKPRADKAADEFAKSFGKTAGQLAAFAIVGYASGADKQFTILIKMIGQFLGTH